MEKAKRVGKPWLSINHTSLDALKRDIPFHRSPDRAGMSHVHAWDTIALREMLDLAEPVLKFRTIQAGSFTYGNGNGLRSERNEMGYVLQKM